MSDKKSITNGAKISSKAGDESAKVYLIAESTVVRVAAFGSRIRVWIHVSIQSHNKFGYAYMNLGQVARGVSSNKFADAGSRDSARALVCTLRVFKEWDPERLCKVL